MRTSFSNKPSPDSSVVDKKFCANGLNSELVSKSKSLCTRLKDSAGSFVVSRLFLIETEFTTKFLYHFILVLSLSQFCFGELRIPHRLLPRKLVCLLNYETNAELVLMLQGCTIIIRMCNSIGCCVLISAHKFFAQKPSKDFRNKEHEECFCTRSLTSCTALKNLGFLGLR